MKSIKSSILPVKGGRKNLLGSFSQLSTVVLEKSLWTDKGETELLGEKIQIWVLPGRPD